MNIKTNVGDKAEKIAQLKRCVGPYAYRALCAGRPLRVWRRSSPWNWFIDGRGGFLWHSSDNGPTPDRRMFRKPRDSGDIIAPYWVGFRKGHDSGMRESSSFVLKQAYRSRKKAKSPAKRNRSSPK